MDILTTCIKGGSIDGAPGWLIQFGYDAGTVEALKKAIPHTSREWREDTHIWWIREDYSHVLKALFVNFEAVAFLQGMLW